jgi:diacylglycerol O-acyltransferase-1
MGQIPLVAITKYIDKLRPGSSIGNMIFWLTFCIVGQPMAILMYTIDYYNKKESDIGEECTGISCDEL